MKRRFWCLVLMVCVGFGMAAWACGPWLSSAFLSAPRAVLTPPESHFVLEMKGVKRLPDAPLGVKAGRDWPVVLPSTLEVDVGDLRAALAEADVNLKLGEEEREDLVEDYGRLRRKQLTQSSDREKAVEGADSLFDGKAVEGQRWVTEDKWPVGIPLEFKLYVMGAERCYAGDEVGAKEVWGRLLALPKEQRKYRSTWAAWMTGRLSAEREVAFRWYREVGRLVEEEGCVDSLRLAAAAAGRLAKFETDAAVLLRVRFHNFRENQRPRYEKELRDLKERLMKEEGLAAAAKAEDVVETVSTMLVLEGRTFHPGEGYEVLKGNGEGNRDVVRAWFEAVKAAGVGAGALPPQMGIAAYRAGDYELAKMVLERAEKTWEAQWILGKLALQKGHKDEGARYLAAALKGMPEGDLSSVTEHEAVVYEGDWWYGSDRKETGDEHTQRVVSGLRHSRLLADLGTVRLAQNDYLAALKLFVEAECPHDAAYVAERLLSTDELLSAVRRWGWKYVEPEKLKATERHEIEQLRDEVRPWLGAKEDESEVWDSNQYGKARVVYLLARRLGRERLFKDARGFYPPPLLPFFDRYVALYRRGHAKTFPQEVRAAALWEAAQLEKAMGGDLFGTDGEPDALLYGESFRYIKLSANRVNWAKGFEYLYGEKKVDIAAVPKMSAEEGYRTKQNELRWNRRHHYQFTATDLAWEAAGLMRGNSGKTAAVYCAAGRWIFRRDEKAADRFYKAMIWRNWETPLAREADKKRWFPDDSGVPRYDPLVAVTKPLPGDGD